MQKNKILVLAPHTDDAEFGCGATINKFITEGKEVHCAAFSACKQSVMPQFDEDVLITEIKQASQCLGIPPANLHLYDYPVRTFSYNRQEILDHLIELREKIQPDLVLMPSLKDVHQDHKTIAEEGLRAFKFNSILCYELPWNNLDFNTANFSIITQEQLDKKVEAIACYKSQQHRNYSDPDFTRGLARTRGVQINTLYAEVFEVVRWLI